MDTDMKIMKESQMRNAHRKGAKDLIECWHDFSFVIWAAILI
jgi:hypothetical protein